MHGEDEQSCSEYICAGMLRCSNCTCCVPQTEICDGVSHCPYGDDEEHCAHSPCVKIACVSIKHCFVKNFKNEKDCGPWSRNFICNMFYNGLYQRVVPQVPAAFTDTLLQQLYYYSMNNMSPSSICIFLSVKSSDFSKVFMTLFISVQLILGLLIIMLLYNNIALLMQYSGFIHKRPANKDVGFFLKCWRRLVWPT